MHRLGQSGIELPVMPDRGFASRIARLERNNSARQTIGLAELLEYEDAASLSDQCGCDRGTFGKDRQQPIAEGLRSLEIVGLQITERALVKVARVERAHHLESEKVGALGRIARDKQNRQGGRQVSTRGIEQSRAHAGRGASAVLARGDLPDAALPSEELIPDAFDRRFHGLSLFIGGKIGQIRLRQGVSWKAKSGTKAAARAGLAADLLTGKLISCRLTAYGAPPSIELR